MKPYDAAWAPSPRRVRIFLAEKAMTVERVQVDLRQNEQLEPEFLAVNPRGTVPALALDGGEVINESAAICRYLEALQPDPLLFGGTPLEVARIEMWTRRIESDGYAAAAYVLRNTVERFADRGAPGRWPAMPQIPALAERGRIMWGAFVEALEEQLADREWVTGERYTFADITALVSIDFARAAKLFVADEARHVHRWHAAATARPSAGA